MADPARRLRPVATSTGEAPSSTQVARSYAELLSRDRVLRRLADAYGLPDPFTWGDGNRGDASTFAAMTLHIMSQQISTAVAFVLYDRVCEAVCGDPSPENIAALGEQCLRDLGLSRAKAAAVVNLATMHLIGTLDTSRLGGVSDDEVVVRLTSARGVGRWTAEMFLIHQLRRPDVLPAGDLGIRRAVQRGWHLADIPGIEDVRWRGMAWSPHRTYAAALLWASLGAVASGSGPLSQTPSIRRLPTPRRG